MDIFKQYFVDPIYYNTGYNIVNTAAFAIMLVAAVFLTYKLLKIMKIRIDQKFFIGIMPFIAMGGILRAYEDMIEAVGIQPSDIFKGFTMIDAAGITRNLLLITPLIYFSIFAVALLSLIAAKLLSRKIAYWKIWFALGIVIDIIFISQLRFSSPFAFTAILLITAFWIAATYTAKITASHFKIEKIKQFLTKENMFVINIHLFEATTTFVALQFPKELGLSYFEQHVVAGFFINQLGPASFFLLKLLIVPLVLYYFDKEFSSTANNARSKKHIIDNGEKKTFLKIIVSILGMGPGLRNFLRLVAGV
jgi:uncharacterized membrane protein